MRADLVQGVREQEPSKRRRTARRWALVISPLLWKCSNDRSESGAVAGSMGILPFKTLVAQATAVLLTRGVEVEPTAVRGVAAPR